MIAKTVFAQLQGSWKLHRLIVSKRPDFPDGTFTGTAEFRPRPATFAFDSAHKVGPPPADVSDNPREPTEYLYTESGTFTTTTNLTFTASRSYLYTLTPSTSTINVWFVKPGSEEVNYFFHTVECGRVPESGVSVLVNGGVDGDGGVKAATEHLCAEDWYWPGYRFDVDGNGGMRRWWVRYKVEGPRKDYITETEFVRM